MTDLGFPCPCGRSFPTASGRGLHQKKCAQVRPELKPEKAPRPPKQQVLAGSAYDIRRAISLLWEAVLRLREARMHDTADALQSIIRHDNGGDLYDQAEALEDDAR